MIWSSGMLEASVFVWEIISGLNPVEQLSGFQSDRGEPFKLTALLMLVCPGLAGFRIR